MIGKLLRRSSDTHVKNTKPWVQTCLGHAVLDDLLVGQIRLVADQQLVNAFRCVTVNFLQPLLDIRESVWRDRLIWNIRVDNEPVLTVIGNVINDDDTVSSTVVRGCDSAESFLT